MSEVKVNKISPRTNCGTVQLGDSGDTITIPAGATITNNGTQTGFGRTGTVDWDTTKKTASFSAVSGNGYFIDTTSAAITVTLPASPSAGDIVAVKDYAGTALTNNITIARNSSNIEGVASDAVLTTNSISTTFVYVDATRGWSQINDSTSENVPTFIVATGGTVTTSGNFKIHTFTSPGTFCVSQVGNPLGSNSVDYLVVAGGGSGGSNGGGGGAGGGYRESSGAASGCYTRSPLGACVPAITVTATAFPVTVGGGGAATAATPNSGSRGASGSNSSFSTITSAGGGAGGAFLDGGPLQPGNSPGANGGSGGGGGAGSPGTDIPGGTGNTPPVSPPQGQSGGTGKHCGGNWVLGGGAGGATGAGAPIPASAGGAGGSSATSCITGSPVARAGGAGGAGYNPRPAGTPGGGGAGTSGSALPNGDGSAATANTGGGGGAGAHPENCGANGGSGIVIIRYKFQ